MRAKVGAYEGYDLYGEKYPLQDDIALQLIHLRHRVPRLIRLLRVANSQSISSHTNTDEKSVRRLMKELSDEYASIFELMGAVFEHISEQLRWEDKEEWLKIYNTGKPSPSTFSELKNECAKLIELYRSFNAQLQKSGIARISRPIESPVEELMRGAI